MRPTATAGQFGAWWQGVVACDAIQAGVPDLTEEQVEQIQNEKHGYEALIASRAADSATGILVKARLLHQMRTNDLDEFGADLTAEIIAFLGGEL